MNAEDTRHLLRRLAFAATPAMERTLRPLTREAAVVSLVRTAIGAPQPAPPPVVRDGWSNSALRVKGMSAGEYEAAHVAQARASREQIDGLRQWWVGELIATAAPLREWLVLFFHDTFGSSSATVDIPHALHDCNALLRRACLGTIPALLEQLVLDPAMMIQIGLDEHLRARVSDRPAKLILDRWTVGPGAYADGDVEELSRALTGWSLGAASAPADAARPVDPTAPRVARRTGIVPRFDEKQFDAGTKTILGRSAAFDARSAVAHLARQPATARRFSRLLVRHLGIDDPGAALEGRLASAYAATDGSVEALLLEVARAPQFWSEKSRWSTVKSPVHLVVGACRQLELTTIPAAAIGHWLTAAGQTLFETPSNGEASWPDQEAWVKPPDRLAIRYQLPEILAGRDLRSGMTAAPGDPASPFVLPIGAALREASARALAERLDPAPGIDLATVERRAARAGSNRSAEVIRQIMMTPNYQVA